MMYAKFIDGEIIFAKRIEEIDGVQVKFPTDEQYRSIGFKPVRFAELPEERQGGSWQEEFEEAENEIVQKWVFVEAEPDAQELIDIILGGEE